MASVTRVVRMSMSAAVLAALAITEDASLAIETTPGVAGRKLSLSIRKKAGTSSLVNAPPNATQYASWDNDHNQGNYQPLTTSKTCKDVKDVVKAGDVPEIYIESGSARGTISSIMVIDKNSFKLHKWTNNGQPDTVDDLMNKSVLEAVENALYTNSTEYDLLTQRKLLSLRQPELADDSASSAGGFANIDVFNEQLYALLCSLASSKKRAILPESMYELAVYNSQRTFGGQGAAAGVKDEDFLANLEKERRAQVNGLKTRIFL